MCSTLSSQRFIFSHLFNVLNNCDYTFPPELSFRQMSTIERNVYFLLFAQDISTLWPWSTATGWSLKTVDCNIFLKSPKISKIAKTQWFLESSYREVLVFWCFKTVRCVKICLLKLFQYRVFATQYKAWALPYTLIRIQTLNKSINSTQIPLEKLLRHPSDICRQHKTVKDVIRHQQTKIDVNINCHTSLNSLFGCLATSVGVVWCLLVSVGVCWCPEVSRDTWRRCLRAFG